MKVEIVGKYFGCETKKSEKGNTYQNVGIIQGIDTYKLYYPSEKEIKIEPFTDIRCTLDITKDKWGTHFTLVDWKIVDGE